MTIGQLFESMGGKVAAASGKIVDGTPFQEGDTGGDLEQQLHACGYQRYGDERMCAGTKGTMIEARIFVGPTYYQRLKHMVADKKHERARGPVNVLTRQPVDGRTRGGGHRYVTPSTPRSLFAASLPSPRTRARTHACLANDALRPRGPSADPARAASARCTYPHAAHGAHAYADQDTPPPTHCTRTRRCRESACFLGHGAANNLNERLLKLSDAYIAYTCNRCGMLTFKHREYGSVVCRTCGLAAGCSTIEIPYACKLLWQELASVMIATRFETDALTNDPRGSGAARYDDDDAAAAAAAGPVAAAPDDDDADGEEEDAPVGRPSRASTRPPAVRPAADDAAAAAIESARASAGTTGEGYSRLDAILAAMEQYEDDFDRAE